MRDGDRERNRASGRGRERRSEREDERGITGKLEKREKNLARGDGQEI